MKENESNAGQRSLARLMRLQAILTACILIILLAAGIFAFREISTVRGCIDTLKQTLESVDAEALNDAVTAFDDAAKQIQNVDIGGLNKTVASLKDAADTFRLVDVEGFNEAVEALTEAAETLDDVDVNALNSLVQALESTAAKLQNAVNAISGLFGR